MADNNIHPEIQKWGKSSPSKISKIDGLSEEDKTKEKEKTEIIRNKKNKGTLWGRKGGQTWEEKMIELTNEKLKRK